ncbi:MAG: carotenoid oxygenase family protein [Sandaracinaceae bacterium]|nr:carotenoid oxygenase family protein [Sandaracinaceae bacterium]
MLLVEPAVSPTNSDPRASHARFSTSLTREHGYEPLRVEGTLPQGLEGTLLRNGPGLLESFGKPYSHLFEGDGALLAVHLEGGRARGAHRVIESAELAEERRRGRPLYGTNAGQVARTWNGLRRRMKNAANTSVMAWQGRLLALFEASLPTEVTLDDLATVGATDLDGVVAGTFSAHPHRVASRRTTYNFGQRVGARTLLDVYALPDVGPASRLTTVPLERPVMLHDFIATERHLIFFVAPARIVRWRGLLGVGDFNDYFRWSPEDGAEVIVIPIDAPERVVRFHVDPFWVWHFGNAYERGPDELVIDWVRYPDFASLDALREPGVPVRQGQLVRSVLRPSQRTLSAPEPLSDLPCEFPTIDPRHAGARVDSIWVASDAARCRIARVDVEGGGERVWELPVDHRPSEPVFVPGDAGGWALTLVYDAVRHESYVAVLDGARPEDGPVARVWLGHHTPPTFHGVFLPLAKR